VDAEEILTKLAYGRQQEFDRVPADKRALVHRSAHAYMAGAVEALTDAGLVTSGRGYELMSRLLEPMTEELVSSGELQHVNASVTSTGSATVRRDDRQSLVNVLQYMRDCEVIGDDDVQTISRRIDERFPPP